MLLKQQCLAQFQFIKLFEFVEIVKNQDILWKPFIIYNIKQRLNLESYVLKLTVDQDSDS